MLTESDIINADLLKYNDSFYDSIGRDLLHDGNIVDDNIESFLTYIRSTSKPATNTPARQEAYELYVLAICLDQYATKVSPDTFYIDIYLPILYRAITKTLSRFRTLLLSVGNKAYNHVEDQASSIISFSLVLYNISPTVIKTDTQQIFLKTAFIETSPYNIEDISEHYYTSFQYIYYTFIRSKTDGLISNDALSTIKKEIERTSPSRYSIYETGLRAYQIQRICNKSDTLALIASNFDKIRSNIVTNEFLRIIKTAYDIGTNDEKTLLLQINSLDIDISNMELSMPIVCKLLRSFHIKSDDSHFTNDERQMFQKMIYRIIIYWMKRKLDYDAATKLSSSLAVALSNSLATGMYIDPRTMKKLDLTGAGFSSQFKLFIELIFNKIAERTGV